jgi:hypothetical protein
MLVNPLEDCKAFLRNVLVVERAALEPVMPGQRDPQSATWDGD